MKRKNLLLMLLLCFSAGISSLWAQIIPTTTVSTVEEGGKYVIYDAFTGRTGFRYAETGQANVLTKNTPPATSNLPLGAVWIVEKNADGMFAFKNEVTEQYLNYNHSNVNAAATTGTTADYWKLVRVEDAKEKWNGGTAYNGRNCFVVYNTATCWNGNSGEGPMAMWSGDGHPYQFYAFNRVVTHNVVYKCIDTKGAILKNVTVSVKENEQYTVSAPVISFYKVIKKELNGEVLSNETFPNIATDIEIVCTYQENLPFQVSNITSGSTNFPEDAKFYKMTIRNNPKKMVEYSRSSPDKIALNHTEDYFTGILPDSVLWCFSGNLANGFQIYNLATGTEMLLDFQGDPSTDGSTGGKSFARMIDKNKDGYTPTNWKLSPGAFENGFFFGMPIGANEYKMNDRGGLAFWTGGADVGSTFTFTYYDRGMAYINGLRGLLKTVADRMTKDDANIGDPGFTNREDFNVLNDVYNTIVIDTTGITVEKAEEYYKTLNTAFNTYKGKTLGVQTYIAYSMTNTKGRGSIYYNPNASDIFVWSSAKAGAAKADSLNACWVFVPTATNNQYYLYNLGRKQFVRHANDRESNFGASWRFTSIPTAVTVVPNQDGFAVQPANDASKALSLSNNYPHPVITYYNATDVGVPFGLKTKGGITDAEKETIEQVLANGKAPGLTDVWAAAGTLTTGDNAKDVVLVRAVAVASTEKPATLKGITVNLSKASAVKSLKVYGTNSSTLNNERIMLGEMLSVEGTEVKVPFTTEKEVTDEPLYIWVVAEISDTPQAGDLLATSVISMNYSANGLTEEGTLNAMNNDLVSTAKLFDAQTTIFNRGTLESKFFGSPAIAKAPNGDLIAVTDVRYNNAGDLGSHKMDIAASISSDNGTTWSAPAVILRGDSVTEDGFGYSSPCIAVDTINAKMYILISGGKATAITNKNLYVLTSEDNGVTWTKSDKLDIAWNPTEEGAIYNYLGSVTGNGVVLTAQVEGAEIANGTPVFLAKTNAGTFTLYKGESNWILSSDPVFNEVQHATVQETATGTLVFTAATTTEDGARLINKWDQSMLIEGGMTFDEATPMEITGTGDAAGLALLTKEGTTILTNIALNTSRLMLYGSDNNCETWDGTYTQEIQAKDAKASAIAAGGDNSVSIFYQTRVLGSETNDYVLTCIKVPYSKLGPVNINGTDCDKVETVKNEKFYDLQGRETTPSNKGIYITKGKKVIIK